jgi:tetratricopeptide (TPR) repeat protein
MRIAALQQEAGLYREAIESYTVALSRARDNSSLPDRAQFSIGEIEEFGLRDRAAAIVAYEKLLADYPRSVWASTARKRIRALRGDAL